MRDVDGNNMRRSQNFSAYASSSSSERLHMYIGMKDHSPDEDRDDSISHPEGLARSAPATSLTSVCHRISDASLAWTEPQEKTTYGISPIRIHEL
ncbi:hypothetical protein AVEN_181611-1 [Araneus ventricosus]|uniref:Uncharacterized protein n=1 Tax=Araneus ventricosus TaxID=182803 RepID=A0A4Y2CLE7_ARAVE|nr:hypothetical protein AVEN_181611-1 [Araneus ventricosus]